LARLNRSTLAILGLALALPGCWAHRLREEEERVYVERGFGRRYSGDASINYYVGVGDGILVLCPQAPEITRGYPVSVDGKIIMPVFDEVFVAGLTRREIKTKITQLLSTYYKDPEVSVDVVAVASKRFFVFGESLRQGPIPYFGDMTMIDVISIVGYNPVTARVKHMKVIRSDPKHPTVIQVNWAELLEGNSRSNIQVREDDIVYIPPTIWAEFAYWLNRVLFPVRIIFGTVLFGAQVIYLPLQIELQREYLRAYRD